MPDPVTTLAAAVLTVILVLNLLARLIPDEYDGLKPEPVRGAARG